MKIVRHIFKSYLAMINNSVGSHAYRNFYASYDGIERDSLNDGDVSCAYFVSCLLTIFGGIESPSFVVSSVEKKLQGKGWEKVTHPEPGDVLVYENILIEDESQPHIGFYIGDEQAISTSYIEKTPVRHDWLFRTTSERNVTAIYRGRHIMLDTEKIVE